MEIPLIEFHQSTAQQDRVQPTPILTHTDVKTQKIGLGILAIISISIGYLALVVGTAPSLLLAIPTLTIGGLLIWKIIRIKDYADPNELQKYRNHAAYQPLDLTVKEHGWEKMFQYGIPAQADFNRLCAETVKHRSFASDSIFKDYEDLMQIRANLIAEGKSVQLEIPHPSNLKDKFLSEIKGRTLCQIFDHYDIAKLVKYDILPSKIGDLYSQVYVPAVEKQTLEKEQVKENFNKNYHERLNNFAAILRDTYGETPLQTEWIRIERENVYHLRRDPSSPVVNVDLTDEELGFLKSVNEMRIQLKADLSTAKKANQEALKRIDADFERICAKINGAYKF